MGSSSSTAVAMKFSGIGIVLSAAIQICLLPNTCAYPQPSEYERGNPIFRDEPLHLHGYTWVLILVAILPLMVAICCLCCQNCQKRKSDSPTYSKLSNEASSNEGSIPIDRTGVSVMFKPFSHQDKDVSQILSLEFCVVRRRKVTCI